MPPVASQTQIRPLLHVFLQKSHQNYHNVLHEDESGLFDGRVMQPTLSAQWPVLLNSQEEMVAIGTTNLIHELERLAAGGG